MNLSEVALRQRGNPLRSVQRSLPRSATVMLWIGQERAPPADKRSSFYIYIRLVAGSTYHNVHGDTLRYQHSALTSAVSYLPYTFRSFNYYKNTILTISVNELLRISRTLCFVSHSITRRITNVCKQYFAASPRKPITSYSFTA